MRSSVAVFCVLTLGSTTVWAEPAPKLPKVRTSTVARPGLSSLPVKDREVVANLEVLQNLDLLEDLELLELLPVLEGDE